MTVAPVVHLVVREVNATSRTIGAELRPLATCHIWRALPRPSAFAAGTTVVVDLADPPANLRPKDLLPVLNRVDLWLVLGSRSVDPAWLEIVQYPRVNVTASAAALGTQLGDRLRGASGGRIAELILGGEPLLRPLDDYVRAICGHPWRIRRPRDLAVLVGESLRHVKGRCQAQGFRRVEHFIVCVRAIGLEQITQHLGLTVAAARKLVGFQDPSNMRRHLGRALEHSPQVALRMQHLIPI